MLLAATAMSSVGKKLSFRVLKNSVHYERILLATHSHSVGSSRFLSLAVPVTLLLNRRNLDRSQEKWSTVVGGSAFIARNQVLSPQLAGANPYAWFSRTVLSNGTFCDDMSFLYLPCPTDTVQ